LRWRLGKRLQSRALSELRAGLDWQPVGIDFAGGQTRDASWRAMTNTMGEVPVLEVTGKRMSQSGRDILMWLAENHWQVRSGQRR